MSDDFEDLAKGMFSPVENQIGPEAYQANLAMSKAQTEHTLGMIQCNATQAEVNMLLAKTKNQKALSHNGRMNTALLFFIVFVFAWSIAFWLGWRP